LPGHNRLENEKNQRQLEPNQTFDEEHKSLLSQHDPFVLIFQTKTKSHSSLSQNFSDLQGKSCWIRFFEFRLFSDLRSTRLNRLLSLPANTCFSIQDQWWRLQPMQLTYSLLLYQNNVKELRKLTKQEQSKTEWITTNLKYKKPL
jgi:hypothetical protein